MQGRARTAGSWLGAIALVLAAALVLPRAVEASPGDLDPAFGKKGYAVVPPSAGSDLGALTSIGTSWDGSVVGVGFIVEGPGTAGDYVIRFRNDGTLDQAFGSEGVVRLTPTNRHASSVALQANGGVVVATSGAGLPPELIRLRPNGTKDTAFGGGSVVLPSQPGDLKIDAAGRIVLGTTGDGILRFLPRGAPDPDFGVAGYAPVTMYIDNVELDQAGRILVTGYDGTHGETLVRVLPDGEPDPEFGSSGYAKLTGSIPYRGALAVGGSTSYVAYESCGLYCEYPFQHFAEDGSVLPHKPVHRLEGDLIVADLADRLVSLPRSLYGALPGPHRSGGVIRYQGSGLDSSFGFEGENLLLPDAEHFDLRARDWSLDRRSLLVAGGAGPNGRPAVARLQYARRGPNDADADGVLDPQDECPFVSIATVKGCPRLGRQLPSTVNVHRDKVVGQAQSKPLACRKRARVQLVTRRPGRDRVIDSRRVDNRGYWELRADVPRRFFIRSLPSYANGLGYCRGARTKVLSRLPGHAEHDRP